MPPGKDVKVQIQELKNQVAMAEMQQQQDQFIMTTQMNLRLNDAKIMELTAKANLMEAQAVSLPAKQNVEAFRAGIEALREQNKGMEIELNRMMESRKNARSIGTNPAPAGAAGTVPLLEGPPSNQIPL
jgi:nitric oxide reductase activation protein